MSGPLTREERERWIGHRTEDGCRVPFSEMFDRYEATAVALEAEVERLRGALERVRDFPRDPSIPVPVPEVADMKAHAALALLEGGAS